MNKEMLISIIQDIERHKNTDRALVYENNIKDRLNTALVSYFEELEQAEHFANKKEMKRMNWRMQNHDK